MARECMIKIGMSLTGQPQSLILKEALQIAIEVDKYDLMVALKYASQCTVVKF
jgi:hypothetical protein